MFKWNSLPNQISYSRVGLTLLVAYYSTPTGWVLAFWILLAAWLTDVLDGLAAKKIGGENKHGLLIDKIADLISLCIILFRLHITGWLPEHFYFTAWAMLLWIPRFLFFKFYPKSLAHRLVEAIQMIYFMYLIIGLVLFYSRQAYNFIPIGYHIATVISVGVILIIFKRERLIGIVKKNFNLQKAPT